MGKRGMGDFVTLFMRKGRNEHRNISLYRETLFYTGSGGMTILQYAKGGEVLEIVKNPLIQLEAIIC